MTVEMPHGSLSATCGHSTIPSNRFDFLYLFARIDEPDVGPKT